MSASCYSTEENSALLPPAVHFGKVEGTFNDMVNVLPVAIQYFSLIDINTVYPKDMYSL